MTEIADQFMRTYLEAWNSYDIETLMGCFADGCVYEDVGLGVVHDGLPAIREFLGTAFAAYPDSWLTMTSLFDAGNAYTWEWKAGLTVGVPAPDGGEPKPVAVSVRGISITELSHAKVIRNRDYWNMAEMTAQLGGGDEHALPDLAAS